MRLLVGQVLDNSVPGECPLDTATEDLKHRSTVMAVRALSTEFANTLSRCQPAGLFSHAPCDLIHHVLAAANNIRFLPVQGEPKFVTNAQDGRCCSMHSHNGGHLGRILGDLDGKVINKQGKGDTGIKGLKIADGGQHVQGHFEDSMRAPRRDPRSAIDGADGYVVAGDHMPRPYIGGHGDLQGPKREAEGPGTLQQFVSAYPVKELADIHVNFNHTFALPDRQQTAKKLAVYSIEASPPWPHGEDMRAFRHHPCPKKTNTGLAPDPHHGGKETNRSEAALRFRQEADHGRTSSRRQPAGLFGLLKQPDESLEPRRAHVVPGLRV
jgi:hypothetical protein